MADGSADASIDGKELTVVHGLDLEEGATYTLGITEDAIENAAGENFAGITTASGDWNFTIGDYTAPVVKTLTPADDANNVVIDATFNLAIRVYRCQ